MSVTLEHYLVLSAILFGMGLWIALSKRNAIIILMGIELMLNSVNLTLIAFNRFVQTAAGTPALSGHVFVIFVITVAAAEAAVALALTLSVYRNRTTVDIDKIDLLKF
ncbi:MAG: NADH-quinone oxidoreductase subunit NuoK [Chloroflexi bacterium]|nr:NADH-quinone oxidoreductase subunit NuoK [Chloroflexota bacterium]